MSAKAVGDAMTAVRIACAPAAGAAGSAERQCTDCWEFYWDWSGEVRNYCAACAGERVRVQMLQASGDAKQRWLATLRAELDQLESSRAREAH